MIAWTECSIIGIPPSPTWVNAVFVNSDTGAGVAADQWAVVDLKPMGVPAEAIAVDLRGILIITPGNNDPVSTADLNVRFRKPGDTTHNPWGAYCGQVCDREGGGILPMGAGQRGNASVIVPLENGCFEWGWSRSTWGTQPACAAYGINLTVQMYFR